MTTHAPGCRRHWNHAGACNPVELPPVPTVLAELGCPPLALRLIEAMLAAKFPEGRVELHVTRDDLRAMLGAFAMAYEEALGK